MKYLYLTEIDWAQTWVNGGYIPIYLASTYLHDERVGTLTPDENLVHESSVDMRSLPMFDFGDNPDIRRFTMFKCSYNGVEIPTFSANYYKEDGLVLSFCNSFSKKIAKKLGKKSCVVIEDMDKLKNIIDKQLGCNGIMKKCSYTNDHQRNHFLKSKKDSWQDEFRIFWKHSSNVKVFIPEDTAKLVGTFE